MNRGFDASAAVGATLLRYFGVRRARHGPRTPFARPAYRYIEEASPRTSSRRHSGDLSPQTLTFVAIALVLAGMLAACGAGVASPTVAPSLAQSPGASGSQEAPAEGAVEPAPGSDSTVYAPNPGAIVVAIDAGHGGCLDWGVPDPSERGQAYAEENMTLEIARRLANLLVADGIGVVMIRDEDEALAGDDYPPLDCHGPSWRDVNGDGFTGFGDDELPEGTRTRDELQARLDVA